MKKGRFRIQRVVLWSWITSYIAIMIIPLLFGAAIYLYAMRTIKDEIQTIQQQAILQVKYNLESALDNLYKVSYALSSSAYNSGIYVYREDNSGYNPLSVAQVQKTMGSYGIANNNIRGIYMYFPENDYLLSSNLTYKYEKIRENSEKFLGLTQDQFEVFQKTDTDSPLVIINPESESPQLYYVYRSREFKEKIIVFMALNMENLRDIMQVKNTGVYLLLNKEKLWLGGIEEDIPESFFNFASDQEIYTLKSGMTWWMGMPFENQSSFLATCISGDVYFEKVHGMRNLLIGYLFLSVILGGIISWYFSRRHYVPVETLMQGIEPTYEQGKSEYKIITDYYTSMKKQYQLSKKELMESRGDIHNSRLSRLMHSNEKISEEWLKKMNGGEIFLNGSYIVAGILLVCDETGRASEADAYALNIFIVNNIISEVLESKYKIISGEVDGFIVYLIHFEEEKDSVDGLIQNLEYAVYYIEQFYHIKLSINLSRISDDIHKVGKSFDEIKELQEYRDWSPKDDLIIRQASKMYFPEEGDQEVLKNYHQYTEMVQYMKSGEYAQVERMLKSLLNKEDETDRRLGGATRKERMVREIVDYIENHYDDWQLSGKMFADKYQVSLSYLSQVFKKEKGIGLLDYINQIRYTKAKAMIDAGATIQEAATRAGYSTTQPLRRLFRQFEGVTPSQSRKKKEESPEN